jgi:hypothetical protein
MAANACECESPLRRPATTTWPGRRVETPKRASRRVVPCRGQRQRAGRPGDKRPPPNPPAVFKLSGSLFAHCVVPLSLGHYTNTGWTMGTECRIFRGPWWTAVAQTARHVPGPAYYSLQACPFPCHSKPPHSSLSFFFIKKDWRGYPMRWEFWRLKSRRSLVPHET